MAENTENIKAAKDIKGDEEIKDPRRKREIIKTIIIVFLVVLLVLTFFSNTIMNRSLAEITSERATSGKLTERIRGSGMVMSNQSWDVTVDGNKTIESLNVKNGKEVKKGDVLMTVSAGDNEALTAAEDAYTSYAGDYSDLSEALETAYASEIELQGQLELANAEVKAAASALIAAQEGKSDSDKQLDNAVKTGEDTLTTTKIMVDESLSVPQEQIDQLTESIAQCVIIADIDGVVTELNCKEGQKYAGGVIAVIQDDSDFKVTSTVDQYDINKMEKDLDTDIAVNALGKDTYSGKLSFVAPTPSVNIDPTGSTSNLSTDYSIEVSFDEPVEGLRIGMSAKLTINISEKNDVLTVPAACVTKTADGTCTVEVKKEDGSTETVEVDTGMETNYFIEIISDKIEEGMEVLLPVQDSSDDEMFF